MLIGSVTLGTNGVCSWEDVAVDVSDLLSSKDLCSSLDEDVVLEDADDFDEGEVLTDEDDLVCDASELIEETISSDDVDDSAVEAVEVAVLSALTAKLSVSTLRFFEQPAPAANIMTASRLATTFFMLFSNSPGFLLQAFSAQLHRV